VGVDLNADFRMLGTEARKPRNEDLTGEEWREQDTQGPPAATAGNLRKATVERRQQRLDLLE
jgi:hypothetical protein